MADILLSVRRDGALWLLECLDGFEPLEFASPAEAEARAQLLARGFAEAGIEVRVLVHDKATGLFAGSPDPKEV